MDGTRVAPVHAPQARQPDPLLLPPGTRVLHIGPHKTGTSSIQSAFHLARALLPGQGVRYAGPNRHPVSAAQAAIARAPAGAPAGSPPRPVRPIRPWRNLLRDIAGWPDARVVISSEWFADASPEAARQIVAELGAARTHVVVTMRALDRILPSQWQQYVQAGRGVGYEPWLRSVLDQPAGAASGFWHRHRHDVLIARWARIVGPGHVTAVIADDRQRDSVLRVFERLTGLRTGTLVPEDERSNRSLTLAEAELVRTIDEALAPGLLDPTVRLNLVLYGASAALRARRPGPAEPRIETPTWAIERAAAIARDIVVGIAATGVVVVGDLADLEVGGAAATGAGDQPSWPDARGWAELTAVAAVGILGASGLARAGDMDGAATQVLSTARLAEVFAGRLMGLALAPLRWLTDGEPERGADATPGARPARRASAAGEAAVLEAIDAALRGERVAPRTRVAVLEAASRAMREREAQSIPEDGDEAGEGPRPGAAAILGVVRATGMARPGRGPAALRAPILAQRRRTTGETLELARLPTPTLARLLVRRLALSPFAHGPARDGG